MKILDTNLQGLFVLEPDVFYDERGYFYESFNSLKFRNKFPDVDFVQDNESESQFGVFRGMHFQSPPFEQTKLVRVVKGEVLDIVIDIRKNSPSYGKYFSLILSEKNKKQLLIPKGFAHGFLVLSKSAIFFYKVDNYYSKKHDFGIHWNIVEDDIKKYFDIEKLIISTKDNVLINFSSFKTPFS